MQKSTGKTRQKTPKASRQRVAILGLGLMGASLGLALKKTRNAPIVCGYARRAATRRIAVKIGAADIVFDNPGEAVRNAGIVVICTPILSTPALARACKPVLAPGAIVTDVGSTKASLAAEMAALRIPFIGSHPIAGSEQSGIEAANAGLYRGAVVVLTPSRGADSRLVRQLAALWKSVGARIIIRPAREHDSLLAATSHLPHLLAAMLVEHVAAHGTAKAAPFCGSGLRDTTRIADGSPEMWHDIIATNAPQVLKELKGFQRILGKYQAMISKGDFVQVRRFLETSRNQRRKLLS